MIIYLYGPDSYRREQKVKEILREYEKKHSGLTIQKFDLEEKGELEKLLSFLESQSLFESSKFALVRNIDEVDKKMTEIFKSIFKDTKTTVLVVEKKKLKSAFSWMEKEAQNQSFEHLPSSQYLVWARREAERAGAVIQSEALRLLCEIYAEDSWGLVTELEKIALGGKVEGKTYIPEFFPLVQRIKGTGALPQRLTALAYALEHEDAAAVFNVAASLVDPAAKATFADYDLAIKSGKLEYEEALLDFVLSRN